jgi:probable phosphoglycerate mutase
MQKDLPKVYLVRHGETAWTLSGKHTGKTDLPLTPAGEAAAKEIAQRLYGLTFAKVFTSPLQRARRTCELAGFGDVAIVDPDLVEWDYGEYEGLTTAEILRRAPNWQLFRDGCPGGESPAQVAARADRVVARLRGVGGDVLVFSSAHFLRALTARWLGQAVTAGALFVLKTATVSVLGYDHDESEPAVHLWNSTCGPPGG